MVIAQMKNSRKFPRKNCSENTFFSTQTMVFEGLIKNISQEGVYIESFLALPVGQNITVALPVTKKNATEVKVEARVVWTNNDGFGVQFYKQLP
jgi:hypothetical protein